MTETELRRIFRAVVLGISAPVIGGASWLACSPTTPDDMDAGDATSAGDTTKSDVVETGNMFPDGATIDSYISWCDAGPPQYITTDGTGCFVYLYIPCGLPSDLYFINDEGGINRCDQICRGYSAYNCEVLGDADIALLYSELDAQPPGADASDDAQDDAAVFIHCDCYNGGRRPAGLRRAKYGAGGALAKYFAQMCHLEAASVPAFRRIHAELRALGAPRSLLRKAARAIREEERHARVIGRIARRFGGVVPAARVRAFRPRNVEAMARENAIEGCVRETYGALVATWQAARARDPQVRRTMTRIAIEETRHAAFSADAARFYASRLDVRARARVESAKRRAIDTLYEEIERTHPPAELVAVAGLPSASDARRLIDAIATQIWAS